MRHPRCRSFSNLLWMLSLTTRLCMLRLSYCIPSFVVESLIFTPPGVSVTLASDILIPLVSAFHSMWLADYMASDTQSVDCCFVRHVCCLLWICLKHFSTFVTSSWHFSNLSERKLINCATAGSRFSQSSSTPSLSNNYRSWNDLSMQTNGQLMSRIRAIK